MKVRATKRDGFSFQDGDRVVFLGCSITQSQGYTNHVECGLLTHFPKLKLTFRNAGWGSDSAWMDRRAQDLPLNIEAFLKTEGREREAMLVQMVTHGLDRDVFPLKPTVVTIMYAANDASYGKDMVASHIRALQEIITQLRKKQIRAILLGFSPQEPFDLPANIDLERYVEAAHLLSDRENLPFVDLYHECTKAIREEQKKDAAYRFTSDGVHPFPHGHALMAEVILRGLGIASDKSMFTGSSLLKPKVDEKNTLYFRRWREIQIPALLANKLNDAHVKSELEQCDHRIAQLEAGIDAIRANLNDQSARGTRP